MAIKRVAYTQTRQQKDIVGCVAQRLIVEANAGAAKTTTLAMRIQRAISQGVRPSAILALAYSIPGHEALAQAFLRVGIPAMDARQIRLHTFDEFATIRLEGFQGVAAKPRTPDKVKPFVLEAIRRARTHAEQRHPGEFQIAGDGELAVEGLLHAFRHIKGTLQMHRAGNEFVLTPQAAFEEVGSDYTTLATLHAYEALRLHPPAFDAECPRFRYLDDATHDLAALLLADDPPYTDETQPLRLGLELVVVDEMHDMNWAMFTVLRGLLDTHPSAVFVGVGDFDQVIHSEAGADAYFMRAGFDVEAGPAARLPLDASYRFGHNVSELLGVHAQKSYQSRTDRDSRVEILALASARDLCLQIERDLEARHGLQARSPHGELAVLLRHPSRYVSLENELLDKGVAYVTVGFESYLRRPEVLFVRGILCCALGCFADIKAEEVRREVIGAMLLFAGVSILTTMKGIDDDAVAKEKMSIWQMARRRDGRDFQQYMLTRALTQMDEAGRSSIVRAMEVARSNRVGDLAAAVKALNVERFAARVLVHSSDVGAATESVNGFVRSAEGLDSIEQLLRITSTRDFGLDTMKRKKTGIRLSSIEAAKGLEFDHVIIPNVNYGEFDGAHPDDRNLFYVGASRARHLLTLTHAPNRASPYVRNPHTREYVD